MKKFLERGTSFFLALIIAFGIIPQIAFATELSEVTETEEISLFAAEKQNLKEMIRPQIEAFAKSINKTNANGDAQDAIITHGLYGGGKKLSVGKSHALTAVIVNSELAKAYLTDLCAEMIKTADEFNLNKIYSLGYIKFFFDGVKEYRYSIYDYSAKRPSNEISPEDFIKRSPYVLIKAGNGYDEKLRILGGYIAADIDIKIGKIYDDKVVYDVNAKFWDIFDFSAENGSTIEKLLGLLGALLFKPFEWESKFNFQIEIPIEGKEESVAVGDADGNGTVDVSDVYIARLAASKLIVPTEEQMKLADVDADGKITVIDANIIRKIAAGIIKFPLE